MPSFSAPGGRSWTSAGVSANHTDVVAFRKIKQKFSQPADYAICEIVDEEGYLQMYDDIIVGGRDLYDGKIIRDMEGRVGYVSQYEKEEKDREITVFDFLAEEFVRLQTENEAVCKEMETNFDDMEFLLEKYQQLLDEFTPSMGITMKAISKSS